MNFSIIEIESIYSWNLDPWLIEDELRYRNSNKDGYYYLYIQPLKFLEYVLPKILQSCHM